jgi:hypothetical protein
MPAGGVTTSGPLNRVLRRNFNFKNWKSFLLILTLPQKKNPQNTIFLRSPMSFVTLKPRNTEKFLKAFDTYMRDSRRSRTEAMKTQARGILRSVISVTPPSGWDSAANDGKGEMTTGTDSKRRGEKAVLNDLAKIMRSYSGQNPDPSSPAAIHRAYRQASTGRVGKTLKKEGKKDLRFKVPTEILKVYREEKKKMVGFLASGWLPAANKLGKIRVPAWISRHAAPGTMTLSVGPRGIMFRASNEVRFAGHMKDMQRRVDYAVNNQIRNMVKILKNLEEKQMKASGLPLS